MPFSTKFSTKIASTISVQSLGVVAQRVLQRNRNGKVLAVFRRSFYLQADDGSLICVGSSSLGAGPLHVLTVLSDEVNWQQSGLRSGLTWQRQSGRIIILPLYAIVFEYSQAIVWYPKKLLLAKPLLLEKGLQCLLKLLQRGQVRCKADGLGILIPALVQHSLPDNVSGNKILLDRAIPAIKVLMARLGAVIPSLPDDRYLQVLLGLGPGLTPSGDDFIGGLLIALRIFSAESVMLNTIFDDFTVQVLRIAKTATSTISFAHLECAAEGMGNETLMQILAAFAQADELSILQALLDLDKIGHSSGWDMLAGTVCACVILIDHLKINVRTI